MPRPIVPAPTMPTSRISAIDASPTGLDPQAYDTLGRVRSRAVPYTGETHYNVEPMGTSSPALLLFLAPLLAGTAGCLLLLAAGRRYVRGRLDAARDLGRRAGFLLVAGDASLALLVAVEALGGSVRLSWTGLAGAASFGAAAAVGLLGGLSGKPRPADGFAAALHVAGACCLLALG